MLGMSSAPLKRRRTSLSIPVQSAPAAAAQHAHRSQSPRQRVHAQQSRTARERGGAYESARPARMSAAIRERMASARMRANPARAASGLGRGWGGGGCKGATSAAIRARHPAARLSAARIRTELPVVSARSNSLPQPARASVRPNSLPDRSETATEARGMLGVVHLLIRTLGASPASLVETLESVGVVAREDFRALLDDLNGVEGRHHG